MHTVAVTSVQSTQINGCCWVVATHTISIILREFESTLAELSEKQS